jgi:hypothetical protein
MALSAVDRARQNWRMGKEKPVAIPGSGDGLALKAALEGIRRLMPQLVNLDATVRKTELADLRSTLTDCGFVLVYEKNRDLNGKWMQFYACGRAVVKVKPTGTGPKKNTPQFSVFLAKNPVGHNNNTEDILSFENELVKFNPAGLARPKSVNLENMKAEDIYLVPVTLRPASKGDGDELIYDGDARAWGAETHFLLPKTTTVPSGPKKPT